MFEGTTVYCIEVNEINTIFAGLLYAGVLRVLGLPRPLYNWSLVIRAIIQGH